MYLPSFIKVLLLQGGAATRLVLQGGCWCKWVLLQGGCCKVGVAIQVQRK